MNDENTLGTIADLENKDRRFRVAQAVFMAAAVILLIAGLLVGYNTLANTQKQLSSSQQQVTTLEHKLAKNDQDNSAKLQDLQMHIDCIVTLFGQPNRAQLSITDISNCQISSTGSGSSTNSTGTAPSSSAKSTPKSSMSTPMSTVAPTSSAPPQANNTTPPKKNTPAPPPHPLVCNLTLGLLGCK